jgi:hypothetical protein
MIDHIFNGAIVPICSRCMAIMVMGGTTTKPTATCWNPGCEERKEVYAITPQRVEVTRVEDTPE